MNREQFERTVQAPLHRHPADSEQYANPRTQELWSIWQSASLVMADRIAANTRRRASDLDRRGRLGQGRAVREVEAAINSMVSKK